MFSKKDERESYTRRNRQALAVEELTDAEIEAIRQAEPPAETAQHDHELTAGHGARGRRETPSR